MSSLAATLQNFPHRKTLHAFNRVTHIMSAKTQNSSPFIRASQKVFGFKSTRSNPLNSGNQASDDEWYIPYTGPYEQPRESRGRQRDSWGDPIGGQNGEDEPSIEPHKSHHVPRPSGDSRTGAHTGGTLTHRRSTSQQLPAASYVNLGNTGGGVGESPVPVSVARRSINGRRTPTDIFRRLSRSSPSSSPSPSEMGRKAVTHRRSISSGSSGLILCRKIGHDEGTDGNHPNNASPRPLLAEPHPVSQPATSLPIPYSQTPHPYANVLPTSSNNAAPRITLLPSHRLSTEARIPGDSLPRSRNTPGQGLSSHGDHTAAGGSSLLSRGLKQLKNSISNPDLRSRDREPKRPSAAKAKDRWLTAETWCDALLFPRPRLKVRYDGDQVEKRGVASAWMMSPPGTLVGSGSAEGGSAVVSSVLAHSRSLEMGGPKAGPSGSRTSDERGTKRRGARAGSSASPPYNGRPRSFSLDAAPPPVPSVAR